jgi:hypothetical protein
MQWRSVDVEAAARSTTKQVRTEGVPERFYKLSSSASLVRDECWAETRNAQFSSSVTYLLHILHRFSRFISF